MSRFQGVFFLVPPLQISFSFLRWLKNTQYKNNLLLLCESREIFVDTIVVFWELELNYLYFPTSNGPHETWNPSMKYLFFEPIQCLVTNIQYVTKQHPLLSFSNAYKKKIQDITYVVSLFLWHKSRGFHLYMCLLLVGTRY